MLSRASLQGVEKRRERGALWSELRNQCVNALFLLCKINRSRQEEAALAGVFVHACAGDAAARAGERGLIASDLLGELRRWVNP